MYRNTGKINRRIVLVAALLLLSLALAGCERGLDRVIIVYAYSEPVWDEMLDDAALMAAEEYNARPDARVTVENLWIDTSTEEDPWGVASPELEVDAIEQVRDNPNVIVFLGGTTSDMTMGGLPAANEAGIAYITGGASWAGLTMPGFGPGEPGIYYPTGDRTFFRTTSRDDIFALLQRDFVLDYYAGAENVYIVANDQPYNTGMAGQFELAIMDAGLEVIANESLSEQATREDVEALAQRIVEAAPDVLWVGGATQNISDLVYLVRGLAPEMPITGYELSFILEYMPPEGHDLSMIEGITFQELMPHPMGLETEAAEEFMAAYEARFGTSLAEHPYAPQEAVTYENSNVIFYAIEHAREVTREGILEALRTIDADNEFSGIYGDWHFTPEGDISQGMCTFYVVRDGAWQIEEVVVEDIE